MQWVVGRSLIHIVPVISIAELGVGARTIQVQVHLGWAVGSVGTCCLPEGDFLNIERAAINRFEDLFCQDFCGWVLGQSPESFSSGFKCRNQWIVLVKSRL